MSNLMFHMDVETALEFFTRVKTTEELEGRILNEKERSFILVEMTKEGLIKTVIETNRTKEQIIKDLAKNYKTLHIKSDESKKSL